MKGFMIYDGVKVKGGLAFDLLCLAGAGAIVVHSLIEIANYGDKKEQREANKAIASVCETLKQTEENLKNVQIKKSENVENKEES